ncbi:gamma-tubulin complex component 2 isoform X3 [Geospiza fortis]|uniref:Gamma-tubulin complex component n=1 Tax=Geospiza fortis TaxID=48883 RepID=A0A8N5EZI9_GEOFO|nr:gamma-tubulin complex component 2 isoform X3 [Geospiza fortis]
MAHCRSDPTTWVFLAPGSDLLSSSQGLVPGAGSMSEFRIHHDVNELLSLLRVHGGEGAEVYIELLQKNRTPYVTTNVSAHSAKVKIAEFSRTPEDFLKKYDELKSKNTRHLDSLVYLLSKLTEDKETLHYLQQNAKERAELAANAATSSSNTNFSIPSSTSKMSLQELEELRKQLGSVTASSSAQQPLELTRKILRDKQNKRNSGQPIPVFPSWVYERPALIGDFLIGTSLSSDTTVPIGTLPLASQESMIVEDLLYVLIGVDGRYITAQALVGKQNRAFSLDPNLDLSIKELVTRILPVAASYSAVTRFIEEKSSFEYGQVNHALAAAMRTLIKEYMILITQLEHLQRQGLLSLQKLWFYIQPTMRTLEILASLATSVDKGECMGGSTLSLLHDKTFNYTGDSQAQELCLYLTKAASVPYFEILEKWIYRGIINDPYSEFMVEEHELQKEKIQEDYNDKYWDQRYTVVQQQIPSFLQKMADKILSTGKYLNVVRECGRDVTCPVAKEVIYTLKERAYVEQIEKAYNYASKVLLDFLMEEKELVAHLRSIKHYFLMDQGDFFVHFMDLTEEELKKPVDDIITTRLEALLELALRMSTANTDPFKDDLKIDLMPHDLITQLLRVLAIETKQERLTLEHGTMLGPPTEEERAEEAAKKKLTNKLLAEHADSLHLTSGFEATINKFDSNFSTHLLDLLDKLSVYSTNDCEHSMLNIIYRLDFNGFYTERLEHMSAERSRKAPPLLPRLAVPAQ